MVTRSEAPSLLGPKYRAPALALMSAIAMASYNNLSVTAALPDIGDDLGKVALLPWVVTVELLSAAIAVLAVGPYIDGAGARRAFRLTVVAFFITSAMCVIAPTMELLVAARVAQGLGGGALIGTSLTCIGLVFEESVRPWAYALMSSVWGIMGIGGPALAAVLVSTLGWRAVFALNLPVAVAAAAVGWGRLPAAAGATAEPLDRRGLLILSGLTVTLLLATADLNWYTVVLVAAGVALAGLYVRHARRRHTPVVRLPHISSRRWRHIHMVGVMAVTGGTGASVFLPLYLKGARGTSAAFAAFAVLWPTLGWSTSAWVSGALQQRFRSEAVALTGAVIITVGAVAVTVPPPPRERRYRCCWPPSRASAGASARSARRASRCCRAGAELQEMGRVSSAHHFLRSLGFAYGAAIAGLVIFWVVDRRTGDAELVRGLLGEDEVVVGADVAEALSSAYTWSLGVMAVFCVLTLPAALRLYRRYNPDRVTRD